MFTGEYKHTIDAKGRLALPADFRKNLRGELVLTRGFENVIRIYPLEEYEEFLKSITRDEAFDERLRKLRRFFMSGSQRVELDSAGRIRIPETLRDYASLEKSVVINGDGNRIELWDSAHWDRYLDSISIEELASELSQEGLL